MSAQGKKLIPVRVYQRVLNHADRNEATGCLVSRYSVGSHGYAQVGWHENGERTVTLCHLVVWRFAVGSIEKGITVDHTCHVKKCVSIDHLRLLPNLDNARRNGPGDWPLDGRCKHDHPASEWRPKGRERLKGYCAACRKERRTAA